MSIFEGVQSDEEMDITESDNETESDSSGSCFDETSESACKLRIAAHNYVDDAKTILFTQSNILANNTLIVNQSLRQMLLDFREKLENLIERCQIRQKWNASILKKLQEEKIELRLPSKGRSFYICGMPYFRDKTDFSAGQNADYIHRKQNLCEFFPIDLKILKHTFWMASDKSNLLNGVMDQMKKYLYTKYTIELQKLKKINAPKGNIKTKMDSLVDKLADIKGKTIEQLHKDVQNTDFEMNWYLLSVTKISHRHSALECAAMWEAALRPDLTCSDWTEKEENALLRLAKKCHYQNWEKISNGMPKRSVYQCFIHFQTVLSKSLNVKNKKWSTAEDKHLLELIERYRVGSFIPWSQVFENIPSRNKQQVYYRYTFTLRPGIKHGTFTPEEDCIIWAAVEEYGKDFAKIPNNLIPGRTAVQIRHRFKVVLENLNKTKPWTYEDDKILMKLVKKNGTSGWADIATSIGHHTRLSCRTRYVTITKYLSKNPKATLRDVPRKKKNPLTNVTKDNWMQTFVKLKQKESRDDSKSNIMPNEVIRFANYFKYSFNFKYGEPMFKLPDHFETYCTLDLLFAIPELKNVDSHDQNGQNMFRSTHKIIKNMNNCQLSDSIVKTIGIAQVKNIKFPPNWNTIVGLRGVLLKTSEKIVPVTKVKKSENLTQRTEESSQSLASFKKIFKTLFYWPAFISQLQLQEDEDNEIVDCDAKHEINFDQNITFKAIDFHYDKKLFTLRQTKNPFKFEIAPLAFEDKNATQPTGLKNKRKNRSTPSDSCNPKTKLSKFDNSK